MTLQISASKTDLLLQCARPFEEGVVTEDVVGEAGLYGSAFHELMESPLIKVESLTPLAKKLEVKWEIPGAHEELVDHVRQAKKLLRGWLSGDNPWGLVIDPKSGAREIAFALDPARLTARRIKPPTVAGHVYRDAVKGEAPGTADLVFPTIPLVMDYKTGRDPFDFFTMPEDVTQLLTLGLALSCWLDSRQHDGPPSAVVLAVLHAPRGSAPAIYADAVPLEKLLEHGKKLAAAMARAGDGSMRKGSMCNLCPARFDCPTRTAGILKAAGEIFDSGRQALATLADAQAIEATAEDVGRLHYFTEQFRKLDAASKRLIKEWVEEHPGEVATRPDSKVLFIKEKTVERLSKSSIYRQLGKGPGERLIDQLRSEGVLETTTQVELHADFDK